MSLRPRLTTSRVLCLSLFTSFALVAACSSEEPGDDGAAAKGGSAGTSAGTSGKGGTSGTSGSTSSGGAGTGGKGGTGGSSSGAGGAAGSKAGGAGTATSGSSGAGGAGGTSAGGTGGSTAGSAGSGGALGGAGSGGTAAGGTAGTGGGTGGSGGSTGGGEFTLTSPAFENVEGCAADNADPCDVFPDENISWEEEDNISPEFNWTGVPAGTLSFAIVLQDLTFPQNIHWAIWNIPGNLTGVNADIDPDTAMPEVPDGSQQANFLQGDGYFGPGSACNVYEFVLYALAIETFSPTQATNPAQVRMQLLALGDDLLGEAPLTGRSNYMLMCP